jgi:hypothetical protein
MASSFGVVENKLREAEFFLRRLRGTRHLSFEADCYFSAFVTASRSVTDAMRVSLAGVPGFDDWFDQLRGRLKRDTLAPYFVDIRNDLVHEGASPLNRVPQEHLREDLVRQLGGDRRHVLVLPAGSPPEVTVLADAVQVCEQLFATIVGAVFECYQRFLMMVDPRWYFTEASFVARGLGLEDALAELGLPPSWSAASPTESEAWRALRAQQPTCALNDLFDKHLGRVIPDPDNEDA